MSHGFIKFSIWVDQLLLEIMLNILGYRYLKGPCRVVSSTEIGGDLVDHNYRND